MTQNRAFDFTLEAPPGYVAQSEDAVYAVERSQFKHWRRLSPAQKIALVDQHSRFIRELSLAGLRLRNPEASEAEIERKAAELWLGSESFKRLVEPRLAT